MWSTKKQQNYTVRDRNAMENDFVFIYITYDIKYSNQAKWVDFGNVFEVVVCRE